MQIENKIHKKATGLGYECCGIIPVDDILDFADRLTERIERLPENRAKNSELYRFSNLHKTHPWAKSIVVCAHKYSHYRIPENLKGSIAKYYLVDGRRDTRSADYKASVAFENYLHSLGLRVETERKFGVTALRWAAFKAGLGTIRKNNFFYTDSGSWVHLEAWLTDNEMELRHVSKLKPCSSNCNKCIDACPTKSLCEPYTMSRAACVSCLTTWDGDDLINEPNNHLMGQWVYGCDVCQDVCPHNKDKWDNLEEFPGLDELTASLSLENILAMDYDYLETVIQPKFWYIGKDRVWKWKVNALNAIRNGYDKRYDKAIEAACNDSDERVRKTAKWVMDKH